MTKRKPATAPEVGIVYLVGDKLLIDTSPLARARKLGDLAFHELEHEQWWSQLVKRRIVPDTDYTEFPRGRVSFDRRHEEFGFLADECILRRETLVAAILERMNLPVQDTKIGTDGGYRCGGCTRHETAKLLKTRAGPKGLLSGPS
jgi:hypothetical protein